MVENNSVNIPESIKKTQFDFSKYTTYGCGGFAREAYFPENLSQAKSVFDYLNINGVPFVILGNGSNVLASDAFYDGAVICTKHLQGISRMAEDRIFCYAGTTVNSLMRYCVENRLGGLEYLAGIPATCGGLAFMNAGAGGIYISENILNVQLYDGKLHKISNKSCCFGYKYSTMRNINALITGIELKVYAQNAQNVSDNISRTLSARSRLPKGRSCGCVFKNVGAVSAGKIIDEAGLKGFSVGLARVSDRHANFIINGGASASDIRKLIEEVKSKVFEKTGILLEEEVVYIGDS